MTDQTKRRRGLHALAATLPKVTRRALGRRGFAEGGLIAEWPSVVGREIAARCLPAKLALARPGRREDGTLTLRVEPGFATELQHLAPQIIERVNGYLGYRAVDRLILKQGPLPGPEEEATPPPHQLTADEAAALKDRLSAVDDDELRAALERLGRAVRRHAEM